MYLNFYFIFNNFFEQYDVQRVKHTIVFGFIVTLLNCIFVMKKIVVMHGLPVVC